ncbi:MAG: division plane positioning ATPase MipZ [Neomegalonema sp.]
MIDFNGAGQGEPQAHDGGRAFFVVIANVKGGTGKSTNAAHMAVVLEKMGLVVGGLDLDTAQQSFFRYLGNRERFADHHGLSVPIAIQRKLHASDKVDLDQRQMEELNRFSAAVEDLAPRCDVVIVDCPGNDTYLSRLGHAAADLLVTPVNDSLMDLDLLAHWDAVERRMTGPSIYSELVYEVNQTRLQAGEDPLQWHVVVNRYDPAGDPTDTEAWRHMVHLSDRLGFTPTVGVAERRIFRQLFGQGLTLYDLDEPPATSPKLVEHRLARGEMDRLLASLGIPGIRRLERPAA